MREGGGRGRIGVCVTYESVCLLWDSLLLNFGCGAEKRGRGGALDLVPLRPDRVSTSHSITYKNTAQDWLP